MVFVYATGNANDSTSCILIPMRSTKTGKRRYHITTIGILYFGCHIFRIRRRIHQSHFITKPLYCRTGYKDGTFQCIIYFSIQAPCNSGYQTVLGEDRFFTCVHQQETSGSICIFCFTGCKTGLPKQSCLLVTGCPANGDRCSEEGGICFSIYTAGRFCLRKHDAHKRL